MGLEVLSGQIHLYVSADRNNSRPARRTGQKQTEVWDSYPGRSQIDTGGDFENPTGGVSSIPYIGMKEVAEKFSIDRLPQYSSIS